MVTEEVIEKHFDEIKKDVNNVFYEDDFELENILVFTMEDMIKYLVEVYDYDEEELKEESDGELQLDFAYEGVDTVPFEYKGVQYYIGIDCIDSYHEEVEDYALMTFK